MSSTAETATTADDHCKHGSLVSVYGWSIQLLLATIAFACLIVKRFCEPKNYRRSWTVWLCDTSKQGFGAIVVHIVNVLLAELVEGQDPCSLYVISFLLDSSVGLFLLWLMIRWTEWFAVTNNYKYLVSGEYGSPRPRVKYWSVQCLAYIAMVLLDKFVITLLLQFPFWQDVRQLLLWPTSRFLTGQWEVVVVVLIVPFFVNVLMFWVTDNFLINPRVRRSKHKPSDNSCNSDLIVAFGAHSGQDCTASGARLQPMATNSEDDSELIDISFDPDYSDRQNIL